MSTHSVVTCKVNQRFNEALNGERFRYDKLSEIITDNPWTPRYVGPALKDRKTKPTHEVVVEMTHTHHQLACCGVEELDFQHLQKAWDTYRNSGWEELVAKYIRMGISETDSRIVIVGIPVKVGSNSQYHLEFYTKLRATLESFGFVNVGVPYRNINSGNTIVAMVGQL